jgi:preprotein translocase subunit SecE
MARTQRRRAATAPAAAEQPAESARRVRDNLPRPAATPAGGSRIARPEPRKRRNPFGFLKRFQPRFVGDIIAELRKVTWPTFAETRYLTIVVAIVAVAMGLFLGALDLGFGWVVERIFFS